MIDLRVELFGPCTCAISEWLDSREGIFTGVMDSFSEAVVGGTV